MLISDKNEFVFFHIAKTGGSSIQRALCESFSIPQDLDPLPPIHHMSVADLLIQFPHLSSYFKFAFVRNPFDKLLSGYSNFTQHADRFNYHLDMRVYKNFEEFCIDFPNSEWISDPHFRKQSELLSVDGNLAVDYIGRFENIPKSLTEVNLFLKGPGISLPTTKHRESSHLPYKDEYTNLSQQVIEDYFTEDLQLFNYSFLG